MDQQNQTPQQSLANKIKDSKNILVTVSNGPSVDQLAACLGLTLWLNKVEKHATAVFSGEVPSTLEFLQPDATLEKNTDSLRDFIISLDKSKADKLRYKVEDSVVKVFVTPYRTSLTADDLEFSQGDFNVDMVIALGVHGQDELDAAITAHGRILHDATVATVTIGEQGSELGSINWHDGQASSLSELVVELANSIDQQQIDEQIATALLTGVVAETERFSNNKTTPQTMSVSAQLMSAGANQQLVATKLDEPEKVAAVEEVATTEVEEPVEDVIADGSLSITHEESSENEVPVPELPAPVEEVPAPEAPEVPEMPATEINEVKETAPEDAESTGPELSHFSLQEPRLGGTLTANAQPEDVMSEQTTDPMSQPLTDDQQPQLLEHAAVDNQSAPTAEAMQPAPPDWLPPQPWMNQPVASEEPQSEPVAEPVAPETQPSTPDLDAARDEVLKAVSQTSAQAPEPIQALNALPIELNSPAEAEASVSQSEPTTVFNPDDFQVVNDPEASNVQPFRPPAPDVDPNQPVEPELTGPVDQPFTMPLPGSPLTPPPANTTPPTSAEFDPTAPPPVPPPMPPKFN